MTWVAAAVVGGSVVTGLIGADASRDAAQMQQESANAAAAQQMAMFQQMQGNLAPWMTSGRNAMSSLNQLMGPGGAGAASLFADPSYQWRLNQGMDAVGNRLSAQGGSLGGNALRAYTDYAQGAASTEFQNIYNRLFGISSLGENAAAGVGNMGMGAATQAGNFSTSGAAAGAAGIVGGANAMTGGISGGINNWMLMQMMRNQGGGGGFPDPFSQNTMWMEQPGMGNSLN